MPASFFNAQPEPERRPGRRPSHLESKFVA
jgi:hypothetical protein